MKHIYLNNHRTELYEGKMLTYRGWVYWANMTTREIYRMSELAYLAGVTNGAKCAAITDDWEIE